MNLFTHFLKQWTNNPGLDDLVEHWDRLERLVIRVYKGKVARPEDEAEYSLLKGWLQSNYTKWQADLQPHWQQAKVAGYPAGQDPFQHLLKHESAATFLGDWNAMQHLPAAREALNRLVLASGTSSG